jgi:5'-methylthioadenosine phosphorylase
VRRINTLSGREARKHLDMLAVIGGSGIYDFEGTRNGEIFEIDTPFGPPSGPVHKARIGENEVLFLARHGVGHIYSPSSIPYRANVFAIKQLGATHLLSLSAVGSLREELAPRSLVVPDQIIDRTVRHGRTFFESGVAAHVGIADPFCVQFRMSLADAAESAHHPAHRGGTYVCIEGPQFSTRAESNLYRLWGGTVVGMTAMPEARLAREAGLCYAMLAMVTDYDVWHDEEEDVSVDVVNSHLEANGAAARAIVRQLAAGGLAERRCGCRSALDGAIMTAPEQIPDEARTWIRLLASDRPGLR